MGVADGDRGRFGVLPEEYSGAVRSADDAPLGPE